MSTAKPYTIIYTIPLGSYPTTHAVRVTYAETNDLEGLLQHMHNNSEYPQYVLHGHPKSVGDYKVEAKTENSTIRLQKGDNDMIRVQKKVFEDRPCGGYSWETIFETNNPQAASEVYEYHVAKLSAAKSDFWKTMKEA